MSPLTEAVTKRARWIGSRNTYELGDISKTADDLGAHSQLVRHLLSMRGITTAELAESFLFPDYVTHLHDPFLLKGMEKAVSRIMEAMSRGERIAIFSDYDADGIPGGVVLHDFFKKAGYTNFTNYIPHRHTEGFGLNREAIEKLAADGAKLVITVDCGIADVNEVRRANELGVDVVITDHHLPSHLGLPEAYAIIDPKQEGCTYPFKELCGSAVAFKLVQGILSKNRFGIPPGGEKWLLDMVGIATLSDMVPLVGENRVLAFFGLKVLRQTRRPGLLKLASKMRLDLTMLTEDDIGFSISPRINAASRMGIPMDAFNLLSTTDILEAGRLADHLDAINDERKGIVASIVREAKKNCGEQSEMRSVIVMGNPDWRPALLGLVANSLVEEYNRPVFLWGREAGDGLKGSCRSDGSVSVVELMERAKHVFREFGGHKMSGGFAASVDTIHLVDDALNCAYEELQAVSTEREAISIDRIMKLDDATWATFGELEKLSPYGLANPKPLFVFEGVEIESVRTFGKGDLHLELIFSDSNRRPMKAICFFAKPEDFGPDLEKGRKIDLVAHLEKSVFMGRTELRLRIVDIAT